MIRTGVFYRTLKTIRNDERFDAICSSFPNCLIVKGIHTHSCDLAVIQGWMKEGNFSLHNRFRETIIKKQFKENKHVLTIDGNIFNYLSKGIYFRYSIDGIFNNTGYYFDKEIDPTRWETIKKLTGCQIKPWRKIGDHVLILMQKESGWTMNGISNIDWCKKVLEDVRKSTDRKVVIRLHPTDKKNIDTYLQLLSDKNVTISQNIDIREDLLNAWCSISYNSSPGAVSVIEGVPVFVNDLDWKRSPAADVCNINIENIENPIMPDREEWIRKISMSHFSIHDIKRGLLWNGVKEYMEKKRK